MPGVILMLLNLIHAFDTLDFDIHVGRLPKRLCICGMVYSYLLLSSYVLHLNDIVRQHNVSRHIYADDKQLYVAFDHKAPSSMSEAMKHLECRIVDITF